MKLTLDPLAFSAARGEIGTRAAREARRNFQANRTDLLASQSGLEGMLAGEPRVEWVFGRDGTLTGRDGAGRWMSGSSVPRKLAQRLLRKLHVEGTAACFLSPSHAAQVEVALEMLRPGQAMIVIAPSLDDFLAMLHCLDFSQPIRRHRLYFAPGPAWGHHLREILEKHPGLPCPQCFVRTPMLEERLGEDLTGQARVIIEAESTRRGEWMKGLGGKRADGPLCLLAPSTFVLWDDAAVVLREVLEVSQIRHVDPADPSQSSHLGLALAASECRAIVAANLTRADLPAGVFDNVPLLSWLTHPRIPPYNPNTPSDTLLVSSPEFLLLAKEQGWSTDRLSIAGFPPSSILHPPSSPTLALICDTSDPSPARRTFDLSTHRLLWELILEEISANPPCILPDIPAYLANRMGQLNIAKETLDHRSFINDLILPAFVQGVARISMQNRLPIKVHGRGWGDLEEFASIAEGSISSRIDLIEVVKSATALAHVWPGQLGHPIESMGRPILRIGPNWLSEARRMLSNPPPPPQSSVPAISAAQILQLID